MNEYKNDKKALTQWDDQRMVGDMLDTAKHIATSYGSFIIEGSNPQIRQILSTNMDETVCDQFQLFEQMQQRGWYQVKPAQQPDIQMAKQKFAQTKSQLL
ncbi:MAG: spore coat protein [Firmicutes bacterium]|nr:spore coat protein [Bacillota bacterium]